MSKKKIVNLGKVKARTKELRLNDTVIEHKYDDEQDWQPLVDLGEAGSSIDTVSGYTDLPTDAKENDVAIVEEAEYVRTDNKTVILPIEVKLPDENQEIPNIYSINFRDNFNSILNNEEIKSLGSALNIMLETDTRSIMYADIGADIAPMMAGVDHPAQVVAVMNSEENVNFYVSGISIRDFLQLMMELELEEEQWATLLGSHANDNSADSPSYGWVNMVMSTEPINDNSLDMGGIYGTLLFNSEAPKITDMLGYASVNIMNPSGEGIEASTSLYSTYESSSDIDPEEQAFVLKFVNLALNNIAHGGSFEQSNDIYNPKGLFQNDDGEWTSLEEKMNTPRFVDTYAELPKTSIENGIMAVANESVYESEPQLTTKLESYKKYRINSVDDMTVETFNSIIEDLIPGYPSTGSVESYLYLISLDGKQEMSISLIKMPYSDTELVCGIMMSVYNYETNQEKRVLYLIETPLDYEFESPFPPEQGSDEPLEFTPELGKWYWCDIVDDKDYYSVGGIHEGFPTDLPDELLFGYGYIIWDEAVYPTAVSDVTTYGDDPTNEKEFTSIDMKVFNFEDLSSLVTITYPAGFYRYNNNEWKHIEDVSGGNFDNEDVLRAITATDIGNIQENTEKRHEHNNQYYLDQIQWDAIDKLNNQVPQNTQARHTHDNKSILDGITTWKWNEINDSVSLKHEHSNKSVLDMINASTMSDIHSNTQSRHSHANKSTLDNITDTHLMNSHTHSNMRVINGFSDYRTSVGNTDFSSLYYDNNSISFVENVSQITEEEKESGIIYLQPNTIKRTDGTISNLSVEFQQLQWAPIGTKWGISFYVTKDTGFSLNAGITWINGTYPPVCTRSGSYHLLLKFSQTGAGLIGEWFTLVDINGYTSYPYHPIDNRLLPSHLSCNFARIVDNELVFAPIVMHENLSSWSYNLKDRYITEGYKEVLGEDPRILSSKLKANDECELMFKEYDDFIIVYWIVTPKGYRIGEYVNSLAITDWSSAFVNYKGEDVCEKIIGTLDTSNGVDFSQMFGGCYNLLKVPPLNTHNGTTFTIMFSGCKSLKYIPEIDLRKATEASAMFNGCTSLITIEKIKCSSLKSSVMWGQWLYNCINLENVVIEGTIKIDSDNTSPGYAGLNLSYSPKLTVDSLMSFINAFEDNTEETTQYTVIFGDTNLNKLTPEQISIATSKNILLI